MTEPKSLPMKHGFFPMPMSPFSLLRHEDSTKATHYCHPGRLHRLRTGAQHRAVHPKCACASSMNSPFIPKVRNVGMLKKLLWNSYQERDSNWKQEAANSKKYAYSSWSLTRQISYALVEKVQQDFFFLSTPEGKEPKEGERVLARDYWSDK